MTLPRVASGGGPRGSEELRAYLDLDRTSSDASFVEALQRHGCVTGELLEIGCGPADLSLRLLAAQPSVEVTGIDSSPEMLRIARLRVAESGESRRLRLLEVDAQDLPFDRDCFDGAFSKNVLHHVPDPLAVLREALRVLRPGAPLVVGDLVRPESEEQLAEWISERGEDLQPLQREMLERTLRAACTFDEYRAMLDELGDFGSLLEQPRPQNVCFCLRRS